MFRANGHPRCRPVEIYLAVADVEAATARAVALGATLLDPPGSRGWGDVVAYLQAPGGFVLALARMQAATPG